VESLGYKVCADGSILDEEGKPFSKLGARKAILNDLSPAATFIAYNYNTPVDVQAFEREVKRILKEVEQEYGWMYSTLHDASPEETERIAQTVIQCKTPDEVRTLVNLLKSNTDIFRDPNSKMSVGNINYTVWSDVIICQSCNKDLIYFDVAVDHEQGKVLDIFRCPYCYSNVAKRGRECATTTTYDSCLSETITQAKKVPTVSNYSVNGTKTYLKRWDAYDEAVSNFALSVSQNSNYPCDRMPEGTESRRNDPYGLTHVHHFYFPVALAWFARLYELSSHNLRAFWPAFSLLNTVSKRYGYVPQKPNYNGQGGGLLSGTLYVPSLIRGLSVATSLKRTVSRISNAIKILTKNKVICPRKFSPQNMLDSSTREEHRHEEGTVFAGANRRHFAAG
jgi:hypothetical protein